MSVHQSSSPDQHDVSPCSSQGKTCPNLKRNSDASEGSRNPTKMQKRNHLDFESPYAGLSHEADACSGVGRSNSFTPELHEIRHLSIDALAEAPNPSPLHPSPPSQPRPFLPTRLSSFDDRKKINKRRMSLAQSDPPDRPSLSGPPHLSTATHPPDKRNPPRREPSPSSPGPASPPLDGPGSSEILQPVSHPQSEPSPSVQSQTEPQSNAPAPPLPGAASLPRVTSPQNGPPDSCSHASPQKADPGFNEPLHSPSRPPTQPKPHPQAEPEPQPKRQAHTHTLADIKTHIPYHTPPQPLPGNALAPKGGPPDPAPPSHAPTVNQPPPKNTRASTETNIPYQIPPQPLPPHRNPLYPDIDLQPRTRTITQPQLVNEVKGIYVGLAMVESKCIEIDNEQAANKDPNAKLAPEQWQALVTLHRTLLYEHHDFMLASQHPSASPALRRVAHKYAMPARMWRHGIHSFLELLRHRLPEAREHMIGFIYIAYSIIALLYESVDAFRDTWVECLGDLSRYRMAIEDNDQRTRDVWTGVSRRWYSLASDHAPGTGRLYHHLAILARPSIATQLFYYVKSLCVVIPFPSTHQSIRTLLDPILRDQPQRVPAVEVSYTKTHAILFTLANTTPQQQTELLQKQLQELQQKQLQQKQLQQKQQQLLHLVVPSFEQALEQATKSFLGNLDSHLAAFTSDSVQKGTHMAITNCCALMDYGNSDNVLFKIFNNAIIQIPLGQTDDDTKYQAIAVDSQKQSAQGPRPAEALVAQMDRAFFRHSSRNKHCYGYILARLVWMLSLARLSPKGMTHVEQLFPWSELVELLNIMLSGEKDFSKIEQVAIMKPKPSAETEQTRFLEEIEKNMKEQESNQARLLENHQQRQNKKKNTTTAAATTTADNTVATPDAAPAQAKVAPPVSPFVATTPPTAATADSESKPLPDDWALRGLVWTEHFYPRGWYSADAVDDDEKYLETTSVAMARQTRILWIGCRLAVYKRWIHYDNVHHRFSVAPAFASRRSPSASASALAPASPSHDEDIEMPDACAANLSCADLRRHLGIKHSLKTDARGVPVNVLAPGEDDYEDEEEVEYEDVDEDEDEDEDEGMVDDTPCLEEDDDSTETDDNNDDDIDEDEDTNMVEMQRLAMQKVAQFDRTHRRAKTQQAAKAGVSASGSGQAANHVGNGGGVEGGGARSEHAGSDARSNGAGSNGGERNGAGLSPSALAEKRNTQQKDA